MPERPSLSFTQLQAAMQAMIHQATQTPEEPVAMAIVDATGNLLAYATMDNLRCLAAVTRCVKPIRRPSWAWIPGPMPSGCTARDAASAS